MTKEEKILQIYNKYIREVHNLTDISGYCSKKTITDSVLNPTRTNEQKQLDALKGQQVQMGDKVYMYFSEEKSTIKIPKYRTDRKTKEKVYVGEVEKEVITYPLKMREDWDVNHPTHSVDKLMDRVYKTLNIFKNVIDIKQFPKYTLKSKIIKEKLNDLLQVNK